MLNLIPNLKVNLPAYKVGVAALLSALCSDVSQVFVSDHPPRADAASLLSVVNSRIVKLGKEPFGFLDG